jgi:hypothetical protein
VAAALALLGVAFYTLLVPWHLTSQFTAKLFEAEFGTLASTMCGSGSTNPSTPGTDCPICKGLAAFQLALEPAPPAAPPAPTGRARHCVPARDDVAGATTPVPRSRGPPLQA